MLKKKTFVLCFVQLTADLDINPQILLQNQAPVQYHLNCFPWTLTRLLKDFDAVLQLGSHIYMFPAKYISQGLFFIFRLKCLHKYQTHKSQINHRLFPWKR